MVCMRAPVDTEWEVGSSVQDVTAHRGTGAHECANVLAT